MLFFYLRKTKKDPKQFKIKVKFTPLPKEEIKKLLFEVFDMALSNNFSKEKQVVDITPSRNKIKVEK